VSNNFADVQEGDPLCYFSDHGYLVVAIKKSSALVLLNLRKYKPLVIQIK
jgi:S-adenosylmethionine hydrolase